MKKIEQVIDFNSYGIKEYALQLGEELRNSKLKNKLKNFDQALSRDSIKIFHYSNSTRKILLPLLKSGGAFTIYHDITSRTILIPKIINKLIFKLIFKKSKKIIVHSQFSVDLIKKNYGVFDKKKIIVIPHGTKVHPEIRSKEQKELKVKNGFKENDFLFFMLGAITPEKKQLNILKDFCGLKKKGIKLVIIGKVTDKEVLNLIEGNKRIKYLGFASNKKIEEMYGASDIFLAYRESTVGESSGPIAYSLGKGLPIFSNNIGSFPEMIGDAGVIYECLENAITIFEKRSKALKKNARIKGESISWKNFVKKLVEEINKDE